MRLCDVGGCERQHYGLGMCEMHYKRWKNHGTTDFVGHGSPTDRFWRRVNKATASGCWEWTGQEGHGYGFIEVDGRRILVHRFSYELLVGPIPAGLVIDHLCRNTRCVNPDHLEPVTSVENTMRGQTLAAINAAKTTCPNGHPLPEYVKGGTRWCNVCRRANDARKRAEARAARPPRFCLVCGKDISGSHGHRRYCDEPCKRRVAS